MGCPRSGTTLLQRILAVHSKLYSIDGEVDFFNCQEIFSNNHFSFKKSESNALYKESKDIVSFFENAVSYMDRKNPNKTFVEKTPINIKRIRFLLKYFPNAQFINIYRDGRDCYSSALRHPYIQAKKSVAKFAKLWRKCIQKAHDVRLAPNFHQIKYENLVNNPQAEITRLMQCLDLKIEKSQLDPNHLSQD